MMSASTLRRIFYAYASFGASLAAWDLYARQVRQKHSESLDSLEFNIGSTDNQLMNTLKTGDVVLFDRKPSTMRPLGGIISMTTKFLTKCPFDHCAVVVNDSYGTPHLLEVTYTGAKLRRFDHRINMSMAREIILIPIGLRQPHLGRKKYERLEKKAMASALATVQMHEDPDKTSPSLELLQLNGLASILSSKLVSMVPESAYQRKNSEEQDETIKQPQTLVVTGVLNSLGALSSLQQKKLKGCLCVELVNCKIKLNKQYEYGKPMTIRVRE